jgi:flagellar protein FlgJ
MKLQSIATSDFKSLNELKVQAKNDAKQALPEVAKQFEGLFLQSMLKTMRMEQHFLNESSPFNGRNQATFQEMLDGQYANSITSSTKEIDFATMLAKQLQGSVEGTDKKATESLQTNTKNLLSVSVNDMTNIKHVSQDTTIVSSTEGIDNFVKSIWPKAKEAASVIGLDPKILMAQAALETGWGKFIAKDADGSSSNNLFNVKTGSNKEFDSVKVNTTEYISDTPINMTQSFRKYSTVEQSFNDYVSLIKGSERYQNALANAGIPELYVKELHKAGYATDPKYSNKIMSIYHGNDLNQAMQRCGLSDHK